MNGMGIVIAMRREHVIPGCVFLELVPQDWRNPYPVSAQGNVTVQIGPAESLTDLDLRPLVGLYVHVNDWAANPARHKRLAKLVAEVNPRLLVMPVDDEAGTTLHRRWAGTPPTTESIRL